MHQIILWILLVLASSCYCDLTIGAFNVQQFGEQKLNNVDIVESLVKVNIILVLPVKIMSVHMQVIRQYDVILIQEIQMPAASFENFVTNSVNSETKLVLHALNQNEY